MCSFDFLELRIELAVVLRVSRSIYVLMHLESLNAEFMLWRCEWQLRLSGITFPAPTANVFALQQIFKA